MPLTEKNVFEVRTDEEWKLVSSDTWTDIFDTLSRHKALTAPEIAKLVCRTRQNVYFHLGKLERVGLVQVVEHRPAARKPQAVYKLTTRQVRLIAEVDDPGSMKQFASLYKKLLRSTASDFETAALEGKLEMDRKKRDWVGFKDVARLSKKERQRILTLLLEIDSIMENSEDPHDGELWTVAGFSIPLVRRPSKPTE